MTWPIALLGEVVDVLDSQRKPITKSDRRAGSYPYYGATGIVDWVDGYLFDEPLVLIGEDGAKWDAGDQSAFRIEGKTWVNNHAHVLRPRREVVLDDWLVYFLNSADLSDYVSGMTVPKLNQGNLRQIEVPLPSLDEQKRIVVVLDQAFTALDYARKGVEENLSTAKNMFRDVLDANFGTIATRSGPIDLQSAVHPNCRLSYGIVQPGDMVEDGLPIVRPVDLTRREIGLPGLKRVAPEAARGYSRTTLQGGELLLCVRGSTGTVSVASAELEGANVTRGIVPIRFDPSRVMRDFAYFQFHSSLVQNQIAEKTYGAALMQINIKDLRGLQFLIPDLDVQHELVQKCEMALTSIESLCSNYEAQLADVASLRQSLLQAALSGQLT